MKNHKLDRTVEHSFDIFPDPQSFRYGDGESRGMPFAGKGFLLEGSVFKAGTHERIGRFVRTGMNIRPEHEGDHQIVQESYALDGRGLVLVSGFLPGGFRRAVIGGAGEFAAVSGEAVIEPLNANEHAFRITFTALPRGEGWWKRMSVTGILRRFRERFPGGPTDAMA